MDIEIFLPKPGRTLGGVDYPEARDVCSRCLVRDECLEWILTVENSDRDMGFVGGMSQKQRKAERAKRKVLACAS
jgi:hypothetical protein